MKPLIVILLVDALGWALASRMPRFASGLDQRRKLDTILGFSAGALPTLFTGRMPAEHGRWLMYRRARAATPFAGFGLTRWLPKRVRESGRLSAALTRVVASRGVHGYFHLYDVPRPLLPNFDLAERSDIFSPGGLPGDSLWDSLQRRGLRWRGWNWRTPESENLDAARRAVRDADDDVLFLYTADLDALLHREGVAGPGVAARIGTYDRWIETLESNAAARGRDLWLYLLSDHGMVDVVSTVDVAGVLRALTARAPSDYLAFIDSTFARFWWRSPDARRAVESALGACGGGRWLSDADLEREGCRFADHAYGESIWLADPGTLIVPSFMGRRPLAAMHGYDPAHPDMAALLWSNRAIPPGVRHLRDVRGFLERELDARSAS